MFTRFLLSRDSFGHPVQVMFKGQETHNTLLGSIMSIFVKGMTLVMIIIAIKELALMEDPLITNFE